MTNLRHQLPIASTLLLLFSAAASPQQRRTVRGLVIDDAGDPVARAVVKISSKAFLYVRSYITQQDGTFVFTGLNPLADYEVRARKGNVWSSRTHLSRFTSRDQPTVTLRLRGLKNKPADPTSGGERVHDLRDTRRTDADSGK